MAFLAPWFLLLSGAALVPLLIHLLRRRIGVQVEFPAARYLARAERDHSRTLRLRNLLLMVLRVLAVVLIAMAAARPAAHVGGAGHAPTALAIVLDNSLSTAVVEGGTPLLDGLKQMVHDVLASATADDRVWLVTADGAVRGGSGPALLEELERLRALSGAGNLRDAVASAVALVEASGMDARQVVVLTDGQRSAWTEPAPIRSGLSVLVHAPDRSAPPNRAVALAEARPARWTPRGTIGIRVLGADSTSYRMALGERTVGRGTVAPNEEAVIRAAPVERGWTGGTIEIEPDELPADNIRHFALWIGPPPAVRAAPGAGSFARNAVEVLRASERVTDGGGPGIAVASADEAQRLPALLFPPADAVRIGAANRALERLGIPWRYGALRREAAVARGAQLDGVTVAARFLLVPHGVPVADTLARVGGDAWVVSGPGYVLVGSPAAPEMTSLPVSAAFLPWLTDVLTSRLHTEPGRVWHAAPGARVTRPSGADLLEGPAGGRTALSGASFDAPPTPGTYFYIQGARRVGALVVNPEIEESHLERWSADDLRRRVASGGVTVERDRDAWVRLAFQGASRRSLIVPLLLAALLLLGVEMAAATPSARVRQ
ncbi:MAG: BatA and WFA domain-containing protein [Gemmatimonadaceae bacterium]